MDGRTILNDMLENTPRSKPILVLDFDGTCTTYTSGWKGIDVIPDPPVPGLFRFLTKAMQVFEVHIHSSRSSEKQGREAMASWFMKEYEKWLNEPPGKERTQRVFAFIRDLHFPEHKPPAHLAIADRCVCFTGRWPRVIDLVNFQPWHKGQKREEEA